MEEERIYFVTNRQPLGDAEPWFDIEPNKAASDLRVGWATLDIPAFPAPVVLKEVMVSPESDKAVPGTAAVRTAPDFSLFGELKAKMMAGISDTIIFIHGFDYTFPEALVGLGLLKQRLNIAEFGPANMIIFTWPSDGKLYPELSYYNDRRDAKDSGEAGGRALLQLWDFLKKLTKEEACRGRIHIVAHSMGNYVLRNALQALVKQLPEPPPTMFEQVLLIAADEDYDALELDFKLEPLAHLCKRIHVYYNANDLALDVSHFTKGNARRLGSRGPRNSSAISDDVILVDASDISRWSDDDKDHHHYYLHAPEMAQDMAQSLKGKAEDKIGTRVPLPGRSGSFRISPAQDGKE